MERKSKKLVLFDNQYECESHLGDDFNYLIDNKRRGVKHLVIAEKAPKLVENN